MRTSGAAALVCCLVMSACSGPGEDETAATSTPPLVVQTAAPDEPESPGATAQDSSSMTETPTPVDEVDLMENLTDPDLRAAAEWVLGLTEPDAQGPDPQEVVERVAPSFLDEIPAAQLAMVFAQLRAAGPYTVTEARQSEGVGRAATVTLHAAQQPLVMTLMLDDAGLIETLFFQPDTSGEAPTLTSWTDLDQSLEELGGQSQVVVGEVTDGGCEVVHTTAGLEPGGEPAPSGSAFKLLVLSATAAAVQAGELQWDQELTVVEDLKSLPSGILQNRDDGSRVSVQEAAELMVSISDNTATDLLIDAVGQRAMREAAVAAGLDAVRLMPVATTRQFFQLGWQVDPEVRTRWAEAVVPESREAILADLPDELELDPMAVTEPRWQDGVDWFLTGGELCALHAQLQAQAQDPAAAPVRDILSANPGIAPAEGVTYQGFKGGSAPGVLVLTFYTETADPQAGGQVLVIQTRSSEAIDELRAVTIARAGLAHLADPQD